MKIQDFFYFKYLVEVSSFTKTAEHFFVSQPSISIALKRLEEEFETKLIDRDRSAKSFKLTATGEVLYKRTSEIIEIFEQTHKEIEDIDSQIVEFGFLPTIGSYFLPRFMEIFSTYTNQLKLVEEESSDAMYEILKSRKVPIALVGSDQAYFEEPWIKQYPLATEELKVCLSKNHPLSSADEITPQQLNGQSFITLDKGYTHQRIFNHWVEKENIQTKTVQYTHEIRTAASFISSSQTVGLFIEQLVSNYPDVVTVPLKGAPKFYINLAVNTDLNFTTLQKEFNQTLLDKLNISD